jgi:parallel beta-helix repeat protein
MKIQIKKILVALVLLFALNTTRSTAFAQGSLTPPSAPGPTMKSLAQIEPRTPISSLPYTITIPGSYYVTTNLTVAFSSAGITISTNDVTVDLNGFTLFGGVSSGNGIAAGVGYDIVIRNGTLRNWSYDGLNAYGTSNNRFERLQFYGNANIGLQAGVGSVVTDCEATSNTVAGFQLSFPGGEISHCVAVKNGIGIQTLNGCVVADCTASGNSDDGINVGLGSVVRSCASYQNFNGITTGNYCTIKDCTASGNTSDGIFFGNNCNIIGCNSSGNTYYGFGYKGNNCTIIGCNANDNYITGIYVGDNCTVKDCSASDNNSFPDYLTFGIIVGNNCTIIGCTVSDNSGLAPSGGINVSNNCYIKDCNATGNEWDGIYVSGNNCQLVGNTFSGNIATGIYVSGNNCLISGNTCSGNGQFGIELFGGTNRVDGNSVGWNTSYGIQADSVNVKNNITRNFSPGPGYGGYGGNNDYAPYATSPSSSTNPWQNFQ